MWDFSVIVIVIGIKDYGRLCNTSVGTFASSLPFESSERITADRNTRSSGNMFPVKFDREGVGDGSSYSGSQVSKCVSFKGTIKSVI